MQSKSAVRLRVVRKGHGTKTCRIDSTMIVGSSTQPSSEILPLAVPRPSRIREKKGPSTGREAHSKLSLR